MQFDEKPDVTDREEAVDVDICNGGISFTNVSFAYNGRNTALNDVSFKVPPGTSTAIVGESGSGKSTILKLLFRFYDTNQGRIEVDSLDIRDIRIDSLRRHIGVVPQEYATHLISPTYLRCFVLRDITCQHFVLLTHGFR